ncbi:MAG TPA: DNA repair protein RecO [Pseudobacteroides sp.]|nr:DNA repair protein RecO [Pseudobacteroides sp.]
MSYIKADGIVIKEVNTGEADRIVTILTKNRGKISAFAKNSRLPRSNLVAGTQIMCYSNFVLFKGRDMYTISSCDVLEPFYGLRCDVVKLTYSAHLLELVNDVIQEEQPAVKTLQLLLNTLHFIDKTDRSCELFTRIFELRFLSILGYAPYVSSCINCGSLEIDKMSFSFKKCGFLCSSCAMEDVNAQPLSVGAAKAIYYIVHSNIKELFNFEVSENVLEELSRVNKRFIKDRLDKDYKKLDFLKSL